MFRRLKSAFLWAAIIRHYERGNFEKARDLADEYRRLGNNDPAFSAVHATIDIMNHDSESARAKFESLSSSLATDDNENSKYVRLYSDYYLCLIDKRTDCDALRVAARQTRASRLLKSWLPLPKEPVPLEESSP